jgi:hypothetical protein
MNKSWEVASWMKTQGAYHNSLRHSKKLHDSMKVCANEGIQNRCTRWQIQGSWGTFPWGLLSVIPPAHYPLGAPLIPMFNCLRFSFANFIHCLMISYPLLSFASLTSSFVVDDSFFCFRSSLLLLIVIS